MTAIAGLPKPRAPVNLAARMEPEERRRRVQLLRRRVTSYNNVKWAKDFFPQRTALGRSAAEKRLSFVRQRQTVDEELGEPCELGVDPPLRLESMD